MVANLLDVSSRYTDLEATLWGKLARRIRRVEFYRTGRIIAEASLEELPGHIGTDESALKEALHGLERKGRIKTCE